MPEQTATKLVIIIPALNEQHTIVDVIDNIPRQIPGIDVIDVVVIDDGSTDKTAKLASAANAHVVHHPRPLGVGASFHTGLSQALERGADIIVRVRFPGEDDLHRPDLIGKFDNLVDIMEDQGRALVTGDAPRPGDRKNILLQFPVLQDINKPALIFLVR